MPIAVQHAENDHALWDNLRQLYLYDLSDIEEIDINANGRFDQTALYERFQAHGVEPFLISYDEQLIGFALVNQISRIHPDFSGHAISDFFILRRYRRKGYGRAAAIKVFEHFPGAWEIATFGGNTPAIAFWRSVVDTYTDGRYDETWSQTSQWRGSIQIFTIPPNF